jgi:hypothetical protein
MSMLLVAWALVLSAQAGPPPSGPRGDVPPELRKRGNEGYDPILPDAIRAAVKDASEAELDPKRGPGNAMQILSAERDKHAGDAELQMALDIRKSATMIRTRFIHNPKVEEPTRYEHALSTFSKLELGEPGLATWLSLALEKKPGAVQILGAGRPISVAVLTRGSGLAKPAVVEAFKQALASAGSRLESQPLEQAAFALKLGADEARDEGGTSSVRVTLDIERLEKGRAVWRSGMFRTSRAKTPAAAIQASLEWLARIGGRDVLFRWLSEEALPNAVVNPLAPGEPKAAPPRIHTDGDQKVTLPSPPPDMPAQSAPAKDGR